MKRLTRYRYEVAQGETVTITVTPVEVGPRVSASDNGESVTNSSGESTPTFVIDIDQVPGNSHFVCIEGSFLKNDPSSARFDLELRGSRGGVFKDVSIRKTNQVWDPEFRFTVT